MFDYDAALRAYADAINDLALRVSELEGQVVALNEKLAEIPGSAQPRIWNRTSPGSWGQD